ncbi:MAG: hypothetical protein HY826_09600 [Actinobacteria bacterium]|nr:hypothetical protein [Actinomycetota bacterium]
MSTQTVTPTITRADDRADRVAARATGFGVGLIVFMLTWTIGARVIERFVDEPNSAYAAMAIAFIAGTAATVLVGRRLISKLR